MFKQIKKPASGLSAEARRAEAEAESIKYPCLHRQAESKSFTLVELLVVVAILGLLAAILLPAINHARAKARDSRRMTDFDSFAAMLELHLSDYGYYPIWSAGGCTTDPSNPLTTALATAGYTGSLPEDPRNNLYCYYYKSDSTGSEYKIAAKMEADTNKTANDGGTATDYYEKFAQAGLQTDADGLDISNDDLDKIMTNQQQYGDTSIVGDWKLDENSWTVDCNTLTVTDSSAYANHGKSCPITTGPTGGATDCVSDKCGYLDGDDDYVEVTEDDKFDNLNQKSVFMWIKPLSYTANMQYPYYDGYWTAPNYGDMFRQSNASDVIGIYLRNTGFALGRNIAYVPNEWIYIGYSYNGENAYFYKNGKQEGSPVTMNGELACDGSTLTFGQFGADNFNGTIDEVRIYNRALSECDVCKRCRAFEDATFCNSCCSTACSGQSCP